MSLKSSLQGMIPLFPNRWILSADDKVSDVAFPHVVIDNFFTAEEFSTILSAKPPTDNKVTVLEGKIEKSGMVSGAILDPDFLSEIDRNSRRHLLNVLSLLAPRKVSAFGHSDFHLVVTPSGRSFKVHDDTPDKLLSVVIYISPEHNKGTFIHSSKDDPVPAGEVEWVQNRAFIFSRVEQKTWHSYASDTEGDRFCVVYNLKAEKVSKAFRAEGKWFKFVKYALRGK
jgi:hypothetical protein